MVNLEMNGIVVHISVVDNLELIGFGSRYVQPQVLEDEPAEAAEPVEDNQSMADSDHHSTSESFVEESPTAPANRLKCRAAWEALAALEKEELSTPSINDVEELADLLENLKIQGQTEAAPAPTVRLIPVFSGSSVGKGPSDEDIIESISHSISSGPHIVDLGINEDALVAQIQINNLEEGEFRPTSAHKQRKKGGIKIKNPVAASKRKSKCSKSGEISTKMATETNTVVSKSRVGSFSYLPP